MARKNPWKVRPDTKSNSYIIDFSYRDEHGRLCRYKRSAGKGVGRKEAEQQARALYHQKERDPRAFITTFVHKPRPVAAYPFQDVAGRYYEDEVRLELRPSTQRTHEQVIRVHLVPRFGKEDLRSIDAAAVRRYRADKLREGKSRKSVNNHVSVLSSIFRFAIQQEWCEMNPTRDIKPLRVENQGYNWLDCGRSECFMAAVKDNDPQHLPLFLTALRTGLRQGELIALRWKDIRFDAAPSGGINVRHSMHQGVLGPTKGNEPRWVPLTEDLRDVLIARRGEPDGFVFTRSGGRPLTGNVIKNPMRRAKMAINRPELRFHDLRHSFASQLVEQGVQLQAVQKLLGHKDIQTTMRYAHLCPGVLEQAVSRLDPSKRNRLGLTLVA
jgi:integrase